MKLRSVGGKFISDEPMSIKQNNDGTVSMSGISKQRQKELAKKKIKQRASNKRARRSRKGR